MIETYVYSGLWWLPTDEDTKLSGQLTVERGKAKLEVLHSFGHEVLETNEGETTYAPFPAGQRRILGVTTDGKAVTLEACPAGPSTMNFPGIPTTTYRPGVVLIGAWFSEGEEVSFNEIAIRTSELDTWASVSGFTTSITPRTLPSGFVTTTAFDIHFEPPNEIRFLWTMARKPNSSSTTSTAD